MDNTYAGGESGKGNSIMEIEVEKRSHRQPRWRKVAQNMYGRRPIVGPSVMIQIYKARAAILLGVAREMGFDSLSFKIHLPDPRQKVGEESSLALFLFR